MSITKIQGDSNIDGNGRKVKAAVVHAEAGDAIEVGYGTYRLPVGFCRFPKEKVTLVGKGETNTHLIVPSPGNAESSTSAAGCCFQLHHATTVEGMTLESECLPTEQSQVIGFQGPNCPENANITLKNLLVKGRAFGIYFWGSAGPKPMKVKGLIRDVTIEFGLWGLTLGQGTGLEDYDITAERITFKGDANLGGAGGDISKNIKTLAAIVQRGGKLRISGESYLKGRDDINLIVSAWTTNQPDEWDFGKTWPAMCLENFHSYTNQNGAKKVLDNWAKIGTIYRFGGYGSATGGRWIEEGNINRALPD